MIAKKFWFMIVRMIVYVIGIGIFFTILILLFQSKLIFFPNVPGREIETTPDEMGYLYEEITLKTKDKVKLSSWFIPADSSRGVVLFCHGNAGNISHRFESIQIFHSLGLSVFIFDYRGYGQSEGRISERGTYCDAQAAWDFLVEERGVRPGDIILFGRSLGGSIAAYIAQNTSPRVLIIESTFTSIVDIGKEIYPFLPVRLLSRFHYNTIEYVKNCTCPILIIHSENDEMIPIEHGRRLFDTAHAPKEFLEISGTHNEGIFTSMEHYVKGLDSFISTHEEEDGEIIR
jgi:fermentation-respiration switch protein FrsA (DUF1100 family)